VPIEHGINGILGNRVEPISFLFRRRDDLGGALDGLLSRILLGLEQSLVQLLFPLGKAKVQGLTLVREPERNPFLLLGNPGLDLFFNGDDGLNGIVSHEPACSICYVFPWE
jgi:hypothetical protein